MKGIKKAMSMYDSQTGKTLFAQKIVDLSEYCPESKQCIIKYTKVHRGLIAQINNLYQKGKDLGSSVHYFISEMSIAELAADVVFERLSKRMGCEVTILSNLIFDNAPLT